MIYEQVSMLPVRRGNLTFSNAISVAPKSFQENLPLKINQGYKINFARSTDKVFRVFYSAVNVELIFFFPGWKNSLLLLISLTPIPISSLTISAVGRD